MQRIWSMETVLDLSHLSWGTSDKFTHINPYPVCFVRGLNETLQVKHSTVQTICVELVSFLFQSRHLTSSSQLFIFRMVVILCGGALKWKWGTSRRVCGSSEHTVNECWSSHPSSVRRWPSGMTLYDSVTLKTYTFNELSGLENTVTFVFPVNSCVIWVFMIIAAIPTHRLVPSK